MSNIKGITIGLDVKACRDCEYYKNDKPKGVYIFKCNLMLRQADYESLQDDIVKQIESGVVVLKSGIEFVEFIGEDDGEELLVVHAG
jgi:hypothetical protein